MPEASCQYPGCTFKVSNDSESITLAMFNSHMLSHSEQSQKLPRVKRPDVAQQCREEDWASFLTLWKTFKSSNKIRVGSAEEVYQLYECCEKNLQKLLIRENPDILERSESEALEAIKRFAVNKVAISVRRTCLLSMKQQHGETFRECYANVLKSNAIMHVVRI